MVVKACLDFWRKIDRKEFTTKQKLDGLKIISSLHGHLTLTFIEKLKRKKMLAQNIINFLKTRVGK